MKNTSQNKSSANSKRLARRQSQKKNQTIRTIAMVGGLLTVIVVVILILSSNSSGSIGLIEGVQAYPNQERSHTADAVEYSVIPPVGGAHNSAWLNCGIYSQPVQNENAVHSLEHGAIWISYQPGLDPAEIAKLAAITRQSGYRLLSPYPGISSPIVLSAWGYQLHLEQADDPRLMAFIEKYERNPAGPEPGAPCTGGIGQPG